MKALIELHFQHERFIENVLRSTLSYPNEASKECIQFLNVVRLYLFVHHYVVRLYRHYRRFWQEKLSAIDRIRNRLRHHVCCYVMPNQLRVL
jgi:hypothetical protein